MEISQIIDFRHGKLKALIDRGIVLAMLPWRKHLFLISGASAFPFHSISAA